MFSFGGITHIAENPKGHAPGYNYSLVGSVPIGLLEGRKPTASDIMGGRVACDGLAYYGRKWETVEQILRAATEVEGVKLCNLLGCMCRQLFGAEVSR